jgi:SAM-dependent methyltransferase
MRLTDGVALGKPSSWLTSHADLLPATGRALDLACGSGRHAVWLAQRGLHVQALDSSDQAIAHLAATALRLRLTVDAQIRDLETTPPPTLGAGVFDLIVAFNYLHRPLFPSLLAALADGGVLVYETFTRAQALRGRPTDPQFLLEPGELCALVGDLAILDAREGDVEGRCVASIVARKRVG